MTMKTNAKGELLFLIWSGPGDPPVDDESAWHTEAEFLNQLAEMNHHNAPPSGNELTPRFIGEIWAHHRKVAGRST